MMNDTLHYTDTLNPCKQVTCGPQRKNWIEYQLLDEQGEPLAGIPYRATNEATRIALVPEFNGTSDAQGIIRLEGLHPLAVTLWLSADPLAEQLQQRRLRAVRPEPPRPRLGDRTPLYTAPCSGWSPVEQFALEQGHAWHYLRVGQLCDRLPVFDPPLANTKELPGFHFPDPAFSGFTLGDDQLNRRHMLEICPLRAWSLLLHHDRRYSLANAYNLALMSMLAYSTVPEGEYGSARDFFLEQALDLSRTPRVVDSGEHMPCLVVDVAFNERYAQGRMLDTRTAEVPEGDTQFFYAINASQVLVGWRGTEFNFSDLGTDLAFRPVEPFGEVDCESKSSCDGLAPAGRVHVGFREAFEVARRVFVEDLEDVISEESKNKKLFICGHSLGGALGLIHAALVKSRDPLLYTYGMPRTFTLKAVLALNDVRHFRHVNDMDTIPSVPPEADLDNHLYKIYGPLGVTLGFVWSLGQLAASNLFKHGDPYCHHGEIAMFFRTSQHIVGRGSSYPAYRNKDGLGAPYHNTISRRLPELAKLCLVPSLGEVEDREAEQLQKRFTESLSSDSLAQYFPRHGNPKKGRLLGIGDHRMGQYRPYLYDQLLEAIDPARDPLLDLQAQRRRFEKQLQEYQVHLHEDEHARNRLFLELQNRLSQSLHMTRQSEGGPEALQRFNTVANPQACYAKTYG